MTASGASYTGYLPRSETVHRIYNLAFGLIIGLFALPILATLSIAVLATQGRQVFYLGERLGRDRMSYRIIKFRTLDSARAEKLTANQVLPDGSGLETPLGGFLRDTRLDELPQILNVIKGDMNLYGPRPTRPEIAEACLREIPGYGDRFRVKPGLIGPTQAYINHGVSKKIRSSLNHKLTKDHVRHDREIAAVALVGLCVATRALIAALERAFETVVGPIDKDARRAHRLDLAIMSGDAVLARVIRCGKDTMTFADPASGAASGCPSAKSGMVELRIGLPDGTARRAQIHLERRPDGLVAWRAANDRAHHIVTRYLLEKVVVLHRSMFLPAIVGRRLRRNLALVRWPTRQSRNQPPPSCQSVSSSSRSS